MFTRKPSMLGDLRWSVVREADGKALLHVANLRIAEQKVAFFRTCGIACIVRQRWLKGV